MALPQSLLRRAPRHQFAEHCATLTGVLEAA